MGDDRTLERRKRLVELIFEEYTDAMPNGEPVPPKESWPEWFVPTVAHSPPILDLDSKIEYGAKTMEYAIRAGWQGLTS